MPTNRLSFGKKTSFKKGVPPRVSNRYFLNRRHRLIYCPIEKNSCTYLKSIMVEHSEAGQEFIDSGLDVHTFFKRNQVLRVSDQEVLLDPRYMLFVVIREPIERIISAYLNKFVRNLHPPMVVEATKQYAELKGIPADTEKSLTFREFAELLSMQEDDRLLDPHWKPQTRLIGLPINHFDFVVPMDRLNEFLDVLEARMEVELSREKTHNRTIYDSYDLSLRMYDKSPAELRELEKRPDKSGLVTPEIASQLKQRYAEDFNLYELATSTFDRQLART